MLTQVFHIIAFQRSGRYAHRLLKFDFPHLQQAVEEGDIFSFVIVIGAKADSEVYQLAEDWLHQQMEKMNLQQERSSMYRS